MKVFRYKLQFHTPAFLGDAAQNGAWRTPPIKTLLRQFWRMGYAAHKDWRVDIDAMRTAEGCLFGVAGTTDSRKSEVRIRLDRWDSGKLQTWASSGQKVQHPEVSRPVDPELYLGYGPLTFNRDTKATSLKARAAIQAGEQAVLSVAVPDENADVIHSAMRLAHLFGTLGGRSRNGWGSFSLSTVDEVSPFDPDPASTPMRQWTQALTLDWPHAVGRDETDALIWQTRPAGDWHAVMKELAEIKIGLRTQFKFTKGQTPHPEARHWLSYPVTHHDVGSWARNLPNSLRFKVRKDADGKPYGLIFHMPCLPPASFKPDRGAIESVWTRAHEFLDAHSALDRSARGTN